MKTFIYIKKGYVKCRHHSEKAVFVYVCVFSSLCTPKGSSLFSLMSEVIFVFHPLLVQFCPLGGVKFFIVMTGRISFKLDSTLYFSFSFFLRKIYQHTLYWQCCCCCIKHQNVLSLCLYQWHHHCVCRKHTPQYVFSCLGEFRTNIINIV